MPEPTDAPLPPKYQRFVDEYLVDLNGTRAARDSGFSERSAAGRAVASVLHERGLLPEPDLVEFTKMRCAELRIAYGPPEEDHGLVQRAVAAVLTRHKLGLEPR